MFNYVTELNGENETLTEEVHKIEQDIARMKQEQDLATEHSNQELAALDVGCIRFTFAIWFIRKSPHLDVILKL